MDPVHSHDQSSESSQQIESEGPALAPPGFNLTASEGNPGRTPLQQKPLPIQRQAIQRLEQPVVEQAPAQAISIEEFIALVEAEEAKFPEDEQLNTSLMITRLRKIWYGSESWDEHLINGVDDIESPYGDPETAERSRRRVEMPLLGDDFDMVDTETYPVDASGQRPEIYREQEIALPDGSFIDMGHVFAGLDAYNHRHNVDASSVLTVSIDNLDGVTWVGDLGSVLAEVQIDWINSDDGITQSQVQDRINQYASPQDMLGNIDAYAIAESYDISSSANMKVSQILRHYYLGEGVQANQSRRYQIFAQAIGLTGWNGTGWDNEDERVEHYRDQVNDAAAMYVGAGADSGWNPVGWLSSRSGAMGMSMNAGSEVLVELFFDALRQLRATED